MLRPGQGVGMRSTERGALAFEEQHPSQDRVLNLRIERIELRFEVIGEGNGSGHSVLMSWRLYSLQAIVCKNGP